MEAVIEQGFTLKMDRENEDAQMQSLRILARLIARRIMAERLAETQKSSQTMAVNDEKAGRTA